MLFWSSGSPRARMNILIPREGTATPALNALASILVVTTLLGVGLAYLLYTVLTRQGAVTGETSALRELSGLEAAA
jgi:hypothetical protein